MFKDDCIFLPHYCISKKSLGKSKEHIVQILATEGNIDVKYLVPSILSEKDIETILTQYMQLSDFEINGYLIISNSFLDKCVGKFRDKIINLIYKNPSKWVEKVEVDQDFKSSNANQKLKKGKKKDKKQVEDSEPKKDLFTQDEFIKHLKVCKIIPDQYDLDFEEKLYNFSRERINKMYENIKVELFESKKSLTADIIQELQTKLEERIIMIQMISKSILIIEGKYSNIDFNYLNERLYVMLKPVLENLILLYCRKYSQNLSHSLFQKNLEESKEPETKNVPLSELSDKLIFRSNEAIITAIDLLPKDLNKMMKDLLENYTHKKTNQFIENLQQNGNQNGLRITIGQKKTDKNFFLAQKYSIKEVLQSYKFDEKITFFNLLSCLILDQNLYLGLKFEEKAVAILSTILLESGLNDEIKKEIQNGLNFYNEANYLLEFAEINKKLASFMKFNL